MERKNYKHFEKQLFFIFWKYEMNQEKSRNLRPPDPFIQRELVIWKKCGHIVPPAPIGLIYYFNSDPISLSWKYDSRPRPLHLYSQPGFHSDFWE